MFTNKMNKRKDMLRFIQLYKSQEILWNLKHPSYRHNESRMKAYASIADETDMSVLEVRKKIKSLRTSYSAEKAKVENTKKTESDTDPIYIPNVFWYSEMAFVDAFLLRQKSDDNPKQEDATLESTTMDSEANDCSYSESLPKRSQKRKHSPEPNTKLDDALEKIIAMNKDVTEFEAFGESIVKQIKELPEQDAYEMMAGIQAMLSKRKIEIVRKKLASKARTPSSPSSQSYVVQRLYTLK